MQSPFFEGPIGDAIAASLQQRTVLGCFITDNGTESSRWESIFRDNSDLCNKLRSGSVFIRLEQSSVEAGYLAAYCPIDVVPIVIFIKNGVVVGIIRQEQAENLVEAVESILGTHGGRSAPVVPAPVSVAAGSAASAETTQAYQQPSSTQTTASHSSRPPQPPRPTSRPPPTAAEKGKQKAQDDESNNSTHYSNAAQPRKKLPKKKEDDAERQRIMQLLENDKKERQRRKAEEMAALRAAQTSSPSNQQEMRIKTPANTTAETHISFRLLSGKSIKHTFPSSATLSKEVRAWLEAHKDASDEQKDVPYSFIHILTPLPNHPIGISEEELPLRELLPKRCTLFLVAQRNPVVDAYSREGSGIIGTLYNTVGGLLSWVWGSPSAPATTYSSVSRQDREERNADDYNENDSLLREDERDDEDGNTYYNGNQTSFQQPKRKAHRNKDD